MDTKNGGGQHGVGDDDIYNVRKMKKGSVRL